MARVKSFSKTKVPFTVMHLVEVGVAGDFGIDPVPKHATLST